jgi:hypothetical protein
VKVFLPKKMNIKERVFTGGFGANFGVAKEGRTGIALNE